MSTLVSVCCAELPSHAPGLSPFNKMIVFDWYDGPTSGLMPCEHCSAAYHFIMVDWNSGHDVRIFGLSPLAPDSLAKVLSCFSETPEWPVWMPMVLRRPTERDHAFLDANLKPIIDAAGPPEFVVSWSTSLKISCAARRLDRAGSVAVKDWFELDDPGQAYDWFSYLGLVRA